jgi:hypothetical protein
MDLNSIIQKLQARGATPEEIETVRADLGGGQPAPAPQSRLGGFAGLAGPASTPQPQSEKWSSDRLKSVLDQMDTKGATREEKDEIIRHAGYGTAAVSNYKPTIRDRMGAAVQDAATGAGLSNQAGGDLAKGLTGSGGVGTEQMGLVDLVPGPSNVLAYQDAQKDFQQGDYLSGTLNTVAAGLPAGPVAANAAKAAVAPGQRLSERAAAINAQGGTQLSIPRVMDPNPDVVSRVTTNAAGLAKGVPFIGTPLADKVIKGREALNARVGEVVAKSGRNTGDPGVAGDIIGNHARNWMNTITKDEVGAAYDAVKQFIPPDARVDMAKLRQTVAKLKAEDAASYTTVRKPVIDAVEAALKAPKGITIEGAEELRKVLSKQGKPGLAIGEAATAQPHFKRVAGALASDVDKALFTSAGPAGYNALKGAKFTYMKNKQVRNAVEKVMGKGVLEGGVSGEQIVNKLYSMAKGTSAGDARSLLQFKRAVGDDAWNTMRRSVNERMGLDASGEFNALKWSKEFKKLTRNGQRVLFGRELASEYTALAGVLQDYVTASGRLGNPSRSGDLVTGAALGASVLADGGLTLLGALKGRAIMNYMGNPRVVKAVKNYAVASKNVMTGKAGPTLARTAARQLAIQIERAGGDANAVMSLLAEDNQASPQPN